jgi:hypothetical protein
MSEHSAEGSVLTLLGVQARRPSLFDLKAGFRAFGTPTLIMCGDEDDAMLEAGLFLNRFLLDFITRVEAGRWPRRIPESQADALIAAVKAQAPRPRFTAR